MVILAIWHRWAVVFTHTDHIAKLLDPITTPRKVAHCGWAADATDAHIEPNLVAADTAFSLRRAVLWSRRFGAKV